MKALVKIGKPAAPALVKALSDSRSDVRAFAARPCGASSLLIPRTFPTGTARHFGSSGSLNSKEECRWKKPSKSCCRAFRLRNA